MSKHQQRFGLDVQCSALVLNFNNLFSIWLFYRAGQSMNSLPSQILERYVQPCRTLPNSMNRILPIQFSKTDKRIAFVLTLLVLAFIVLTLMQDFLRSELKNSSFYFSESFMFSSFWWLFAPLLFSQYLAFRFQKCKPFFYILPIGIVTNKV